MSAGAKLAVVAIGGNSLIRDQDHQSIPDQYETVTVTARQISDIFIRPGACRLVEADAPSAGRQHARPLAHGSRGHEDGFGDRVFDREFADRLVALPSKRFVIVLDRFERGHGAVGDGAHKAHDVKRRLGQIDLAPEKRDARAIFFCLMDEFETVPGRARSATQQADDETGVE